MSTSCLWCSVCFFRFMTRDLLQSSIQNPCSSFEEVVFCYFLVPNVQSVKKQFPCLTKVTKHKPAPRYGGHISPVNVGHLGVAVLFTWRAVVGLLLDRLSHKEKTFLSKNPSFLNLKSYRYLQKKDVDLKFFLKGPPPSSHPLSNAFKFPFEVGAVHSLLVVRF